MADTTYVDFSVPPVNAAWLNDSNIVVYRALGAAGVPPTTAAQVMANLGAATAASVTAVAASVTAVSAGLAASTGSALVGFLQAGAGAVARTDQAKSRESISVKDFGAVGDGITDDTAAFNLATQSTAVWSQALSYDIVVPSGVGIKYKLNGSVYVRKGQSIRGNGLAGYIDASGNASTNTFIMGRGLISGVPTDDAGGQPVAVENFFILGGNAVKASIISNAAGYSIKSIFFSSVGIALDLGGADALLSNIEIDVSQIAMIFNGAQNIIISNFNIYVANYAIQFNNDCRDITFSNGIIEYPVYAGILTAPGQTNVKAISFSNVNFTMNVQNATFTGYVVSNASSVEMQFTGCSFRNWYQWAINHSTGVTAKLTFTGCVFDANKTTTAYAQSTTARVINTAPSGGDGTYNFFGCEYRNLPAEIATINDGLTKLSMVGGYVSGCDANAISQKRLNVVTTTRPAITVKGVAGFGYKTNDASNQILILPYWGGDSAWKVGVKANPFASGDSAYGRQEEGVYTVSYAYNGVDKRMYADKTLIWKTPSRTIPSDLAAVVCFGTAVGGPTTGSANTPTSTGTICVSYPATVANSSAVEWYAETAT